MRPLFFLIAILFLFSCKKDETKHLIVRNGLDQTSIPRYTSSTYVESVLIMYYDVNGVRVRSDEFPIPFSSVQNMRNYVVTSTELQDNIVSMFVLVRFYDTKINIISLEYDSELIEINNGLNEYTITESNSNKYPE